MQASEGPIQAMTPETAAHVPGAAEPLADHDAEEDGGHIHLPPPSIWPITTAAGVAVAGLGLVTDVPFIIVGVLVMGYGLSMWIQELRHEPH
jgi:hypothetical protein